MKICMMKIRTMKAPARVLRAGAFIKRKFEEITFYILLNSKPASFS